MKESSLPAGPAALPLLSLRSPSAPQGPPAPRPGPGQSGRARTEVSRAPRDWRLAGACVARVGVIDPPSARRPPPGALGVARARQTGRGGRRPCLPPAGGGDSGGAESGPGPPCSVRAPPCAQPRAAELLGRSGAAGPEHPAPLGARGIGSQRSCARGEGAQGRRERVPGPRDRAVSSQGSRRKSPTHTTPEPAGAADCSPERGSFPRRRDNLSFASLGRSQSFWRALCWESPVYCGHPGKGSSLHLDQDATETSHRFLPLFASGAFQCAVGLAFVNLMRFWLSPVLVLSRCQGCGAPTLFIKDSFWTAFCFECSTISIVRD